MTSPSNDTSRGSAQRLRIGSIVVDFRYSQLLRDQQELPLPPRACDLLALFLSRPGVLLSREDIFRLVWRDVLVEDSNLTQTVWLLRRALGEEGKVWIRTVSKRGYVFEGPLIEVLGDTGVRRGEHAVPDAPMPDDADARPAPAMPAVPTMPLRRSAMGRYAAVAAALLLAVIGGYRGLRAYVPVDEGRIVVVDAIDRNVADPVVDAVLLSHAWIVWQLGDLDLRDVVPAATSASVGTPHRSDRVLLLSAHLDGEPPRIVIDAQLVGSAAAHWQVAGSGNELPALVDALSRRVVDGIGVGDAGDGVAFALPQDAALRFALALRAQRDGQSAAALAALDDTVRRAPDFPFARLQLAQRLSELGRLSAANEHMAALSAWIDAQPPTARELLRAQRAAIGQDFVTAAAGYTALAKRYPRQWRLRLEQARNLVAGDRADEALDVLGTQGLDIEPVSLQAEWLLLRARAQQSLGALRLARASAERASTLARRDENADIAAHAQLLIALVDVMTTGGRADVDALTEAARHFETTGDEFSALRARIAAATLGSTFVAAQAHAAVDALLSRARSVGNPALEVQALRDRSRLALRESDFDNYRKSLAEARTVAEGVGDGGLMRGVQADLLYDDILSGDYASAGRRSEPWKNVPPRGPAGIDLGVNEALLDWRKGDFAVALERLGAVARANSKAGEGSATPTVPAMTLDCRRGIVRLRQGSIEDAQRKLSLCAEALSPRERFSAGAGLAMIAMLSGDTDGARTRLGEMRTQLANASLPTQRASRLIYLAPALMRLGDSDEAQRLVDDDLAYGERGGFRVLQGLAWLRKAEIALLRRRPDEAARAVARARKVLPPEDWLAAADAGLIEAVIALARGDDATALPALRGLLDDARRRGDIVVQLEAMSLVPDQLDAIGVSQAAYEELVARTGMRGASRRWLLVPTPAR